MKADHHSAMGVDADPLLQRRSSSLYDDQDKPISPVKEFKAESRVLWRLAGPAILTYLAQYSLGAFSQTFAGQIGELELAAVSVENSIVGGFAYGVMLGMGSALETLAGQAFGAGQIRMLGVYMQRSWIILLVTACILIPFYIWSPSVLMLLGETREISEAAGKFAIWMIPQCFAYAINFPIQKFLQSQGKVMVMTWVSIVVLVAHIFFTWLLVLKLGWGLAGLAITLNISWWLVIIGQLVYIFVSKSGGAWSGFSWMAFQDLYGFVKLSLASAIMLSLEFWNLMILTAVTGLLKDPLISVDAISICMNLQGWYTMVSFGFNAAISIRVSNELGAGRPRAAKFSVFVVSLTSTVISLVAMVIVILTKDYYPWLFTNSTAVANKTTELSTLLAITIVLNGLQPVLSGVAVGAGWQAVVAYVNVACYYIIGLPAGILLGFTFDLAVEGLWSGMIGGIVLQTIVLIAITAMTNWEKEAEEAEGRVKKWGGGSFRGGSFRSGSFVSGSFISGSFRSGSFRSGSFTTGSFRT